MVKGLESLEHSGNHFVTYLQLVFNSGMAYSKQPWNQTYHHLSEEIQKIWYV